MLVKKTLDKTFLKLSQIKIANFINKILVNYLKFRFK